MTVPGALERGFRVPLQVAYFRKGLKDDKKEEYVVYYVITEIRGFT